MNKVLRIGLVAICLGFIFSSVSVSEAKAQNILGEILRRMDNYNKSLQSLKADVTMVKTDVVLKVSDTYVGTTSFLPKTASRSKIYARIDWTKPLNEQISVIGDNYELYRPHISTVIRGTRQKAKNGPSVGGALDFMNMSKAQLKANYDVIYIGEEQISGGAKTWHVQLTPKTASSYKLADLWIDSNGTPLQAKITEKNNDTTTVLLTRLQKNVKINADDFKLAYDSKKVKFVQG